MSNQPKPPRIVIKIENGHLVVAGPFEQRQLCLEMLQEAMEIVRTFRLPKEQGTHIELPQQWLPSANGQQQAGRRL